METGTGKTVLHIEDELSLQKLVRAALGSLGHVTVQTAAEGLRAIELARESAPDLILLDEGLPDLSGSNTFAALRRLPGVEHVPVIFFTGSTDPQLHARLMGLGAHDILVKPCRPRLIVQAVELGLQGESVYAASLAA